MPEHFYRQSAVIPHRRQEGALQILLISSRRKKRWVVPKGVVELHLTAQESARAEALEEAGVEGLVSEELLGIYEYRKWGGTCRVEVFAMEVLVVHDSWPENHRDRQWMPPEEAAARIEEPGLGQIILTLADHLGPFCKRH